MATNQIFISYRREESAGHAARLAADLQRHFDRETVFFDSQRIRPGQRFPPELENAVRESEVVLAVIGATWVTCVSPSGKRRLEEKTDWVRKELRLALSTHGGSSRMIIPVLVEDASMPGKSDLQRAGLARLSDFQAIKLPDLEPLWQSGYHELLNRLDETLGVTPEERERDWIYNYIAATFDHLSENQRRSVGDELAKQDGEVTSVSPRALARRFYRIGPLAMESLDKVFVLDESLRPMLERLKDYWVTTDASETLAETWRGSTPFRATIVLGKENPFTPDCIVQKASKSMRSWPMLSIVSAASQPSIHDVIEDIHDWLRGLFAEPLRREGLPDLRNEAVTQALQHKLARRAELGRPLAVQLDEIGSADKPLIRAIQQEFPHLRILILAPAAENFRDLEEKYFFDIEQNLIRPVMPEASEGDEQKAVEAYRQIDEELTNK